NAFVNQDDFKEVAEQCQMIGLLVWRSTPKIPEHQLDDTVRRALTDLKSSIDVIRDAVKLKAKQNLWLKAFHVAVNQETILKSIQEPGVLPVRSRVFVGRDGLVQRTTETLLGVHHVALIGPGGIGKSSVARAVLNDEAITSKFQNRRFFARFDDMDASQINLGTFLDRIARALGSSTSANVHDLISKALSTSDTLLVLDNAETFLDAPVDAGRIADAIDGFGARLNVAILITTRTTVLPPNIDWVRLRVPVLEESAACEAFKAYYPSIETPILIKLLAAVDFHPLSINLLAQAAVQNEWSSQDLMTAWDRQRAALLEAGDGKVQSLAITIETSLNSPSFCELGDTAHHLLHIIAFLPQGISKTRLTSIFPAIEKIDICADALCKQSLAYLNGDFITLLAPIRLYITSHYNGNPNPFLEQVRSHYVAHVSDSKIVAQDNVNIEHVLTHWLKASGDPADVLFSTAQFILTLTHYCCRSVSLHPVVSALKISKSRLQFSIRTLIFQKSTIIHAKSHCLLAISHLLHWTGQRNEAKETLAEAQALIFLSKDPHLFAHTEYVLAVGYYQQGNYLAAEETLQKALSKLSHVSTIFTFSTHTWKKLIKITLARLYMIQGIPNSFQDYIDALPMLRKEWYRKYISCYHITAGFTELYNKHLDGAKSCFNAMQAGRDNDELEWLIGLLGLAEVADQQHNYEESKALRSQLLESVQKMPDQTIPYVNEITALLAGYLAMEGHVEQARTFILPAVKNASNFLTLNTMKCKYFAGMVELAGKNFGKAERYFSEAIEDCFSFAELLYNARSHRALGEIAIVKQDMESARNHFEVTIELCKTMGLPKEHLFSDFRCCIPSERFNGWKLYQEGHSMFQVSSISCF
ncbi:hypothetical protein C0993_003470, partial [Termitomyces sp. T159_Od127]